MASASPHPTLTATAAPAAISVTATRVVSFKPTDSNDYLKPGIKVSGVLHEGMCNPGSDTVGDSAFRCFAGNDVLDPCFPAFTAGMEIVACMSNPWDTSVTEIYPGSALPTLQATGGDVSNQPWGIQLATGARCSELDGAGDSYNGQPIGYSCGKNLFLAGAVGGQGQLHTANVVRRNPATDTYTFVGVYEIAAEWVATADSTQPVTAGTSLNGAGVAAFIESRTGDSSVQCPQTMAITVGATYACSGAGTSYVVTIVNAAGVYTVNRQY